MTALRVYSTENTRRAFLRVAVCDERGESMKIYIVKLPKFVADIINKLRGR